MTSTHGEYAKKGDKGKNNTFEMFDPGERYAPGRASIDSAWKKMLVVYKWVDL